MNPLFFRRNCSAAKRQIADKGIKISDHAAIVNFIIGLDGCMISNGIFLGYLISA
jgi:hypothetical protein